MYILKSRDFVANSQVYSKRFVGIGEEMEGLYDLNSGVYFESNSLCKNDTYILCAGFGISVFHTVSIAISCIVITSINITL